jgi:hypothetical protein
MKATADVQSFFKKQNAPVTMGLICGIVGVSVLLFLLHQSGLASVVSRETLHLPWVFLTYPFVNNLVGGFGVIAMLFLGYWLYWVGTSLERDLGSLRLGLLWVIGAILEAACVAIVGQFVGGGLYMIGGALLPVSVFTVIWGERNRNACVRLMGCIPINGYWMMWLTAAIVFADLGVMNLLLGVAGCLPLALAWAYAANRIPRLAYGRPAPVYKPSKAQRQKEERFFDDVRKREQERQDRERLRKLFEGSLEDER